MKGRVLEEAFERTETVSSLGRCLPAVTLGGRVAGSTEPSDLPASAVLGFWDRISPQRLASYTYLDAPLPRHLLALRCLVAYTYFGYPL